MARKFYKIYEQRFGSLESVYNFDLFAVIDRSTEFTKEALDTYELKKKALETDIKELNGQFKILREKERQLSSTYPCVKWMNCPLLEVDGVVNRGPCRRQHTRAIIDTIFDSAEAANRIKYLLWLSVVESRKSIDKCLIIFRQLQNADDNAETVNDLFAQICTEISAQFENPALRGLLEQCLSELWEPFETRFHKLKRDATVTFGRSLCQNCEYRDDHERAGLFFRNEHPIENEKEISLLAIFRFNFYGILIELLLFAQHY